MRRSLGLLAASICLFASTLQVQADVIWEPRQDAFYAEYAHRCVYENSTYIANGPEGKVIVNESPESLEEKTVWENGKSVYISFTYEDEAGVLWGIYDNGDVAESGWIRIDHMIKKYDSEAFEEEFAEQIVKESGSVDRDGTPSVYFWSYPGAKEKNSVNIAGFNAPEYSRTFTDEAGYKWGYIGYYYGMKKNWVCLDNPAAELEELYPEDAPKRGALLIGTDEVVVGTEDVMLITAESATQTQEESTGIQEETVISQEDTSPEVPEEEEVETQVPFVAAIVAAVVAVTGALLALVKRSFQTKNNEK